MFSCAIFVCGLDHNRTIVSTNREGSDKAVRVFDKSILAQEINLSDANETPARVFNMLGIVIRTDEILEYSRLPLSRSPRDSLKYIEISVPRHIRFAELRKNKSNNHISQVNM